MARNRETKIELTAYDDLFQTDESRAEAALSKIRDIPLSEIDEFPDHPFKVLMDEDMEQLVESVKRNGVMTPTIKTGIIWASYEKLVQEGEDSKENKERPSFSAAIYTAYWVIATAVYLGYSLSSNNWGQSWIIWVVAGVIFPAVIAITNAFEKKSK